MKTRVSFTALFLAMFMFGNAVSSNYTGSCKTFKALNFSLCFR